MKLYLYLYEILNKLYRFYLSVFFSKRIHIYKSVKIDWQTRFIQKKDTSVILEENVNLRSNKIGYHAGMNYPVTFLLDNKNATVRIGKNTRLNGVYIHAEKNITIGKNCVIAANVNILDSNGHILNSLNRTLGRDTPSPIIIGNNVWIGLNSIILKETTIGDNSVVAAGSIVKGNFPENVLIAGNPATVVKELNLKELNQ